MATTKTTKPQLMIKRRLGDMMSVTIDEYAMYIKRDGKRVTVYTITLLPRQYDDRSGCWKLSVYCAADHYADEWRYPSLEAMKTAHPHLPYDKRMWTAEYRDYRFA